MHDKKKLQEDMKKLQSDLDKVTEAISKSVRGNVKAYAVKNHVC